MVGSPQQTKSWNKSEEDILQQLNLTWNGAREEKNDRERRKGRIVT